MTYEYMCHGDCKKVVEAEHKMLDTLTKCPKCGGKVTKLISRSNFVLKGEGWANTGYGLRPPGSK